MAEVEADRLEWRLCGRLLEGLLSGVGVVLKLRSLSANLRIWLTVKGACRVKHPQCVASMWSCFAVGEVSQ